MKANEIKKVLDQVNKNHKSELFVVLGQAGAQPMPRVQTGLLSIDIPFGGGVPNGRIIELYGEESSGKTTIALHIAAAYQKQIPDRAIAFVDYEHSFDEMYAQALGIDTNQLVLSQPKHMEEGLQGIDELVDTGAFSCIVIDSVSAMVPKSELEGEMGKASVGVQAKIMSQAMRKLVGKTYKADTTLIFINQLRSKIGVMFGDPRVTSGGNALKYYSSIRAEVQRGSKQKGKDDHGDEVVIANRGRLKVSKNKTARPFVNSEFDIEFGRGLCPESDILDYAIMYNLVEQKGSWFNYYDSPEKTKESKVSLGQGRPAVIKFLEDNKEFTEALKELILKELT